MKNREGNPGEQQKKRYKRTGGENLKIKKRTRKNKLITLFIPQPTLKPVDNNLSPPLPQKINKKILNTNKKNKKKETILIVSQPSLAPTQPPSPASRFPSSSTPASRPSRP